ncbi:MAG: aspartate carbamoyltransferase [Gammaproteobacteria bacterium]
MKHLTVASLLIGLSVAVPALAVEKASEQRLDEVAQRGSHVMPFNLEQTTHVFSKTEKGGLQQVIAKDDSNIDQIRLIREHLSKISQEFKQGDFADPEKIHGEGMPGLSELRRAQPGQIKIVYKDLANGAEIDYSTDNAKLIETIHKWFDAQLRDHSRHAIQDHDLHQMHHNQ